MGILYWITEYAKVLCGYLFLMFLWPTVVFGRHLKGKKAVYRFGFCVTVPIVAANTVVLTSGLFHILHGWIVAAVFHGIFIFSILKKAISWCNREYGKTEGVEVPDVHILYGKYNAFVIFFAALVLRVSYSRKAVVSLIVRCAKRMKQPGLNRVTGKVKKALVRRTGVILKKYYLPGIVLLYGMAYFSYGAFQIHSYGYGDLYVHHQWIQGMMEGRIFSGGIYPAAMHCFIYCMDALLGIPVYSSLLFIQGIHVSIFLISAYLLLRWTFHCRYTPVLVLMLFLTLDLGNADLIHSMFRLQITLPMEFGLHTVCLSALFLAGYLHDGKKVTKGENSAKYYFDGNLFLFMMAVMAGGMTHFHVLIMAGIVCAVFMAVEWKQILNRKYLFPVASVSFCACLLATAPMAGAVVTQGVPFSTSIDWAVNSMDGAESRKQREQLNRTENGEEFSEEAWQNEREQKNSVMDFISVLPEIYREGYVALYGSERGKYFFLMTILLAEYCLLIRNKERFRYAGAVCSRYLPVILCSVFYVTIYAAPMVGMPDIIPEGRFFALGHMMLLAVVLMPIDILFSESARFCRESVLQMISCLSVAGIYGGLLVSGSFRGYLFYELTRYNAAVHVTNSIISTYPSHSYTIVSPTDELYQVIQQGWHEELLSFVEKSSSSTYTIPTEYVFLYVEKHPLLYAQSHFFTGPAWMGEEKYAAPYWEMYSLKYPDSDVSQSPTIKASQVSEKAAGQELPKDENPWMLYTRLENRTILESRLYEWCRWFSEQNPSVLDVYYEDDDFVCYYFRQDSDTGFYDLGMK